MYKQIKLSVKTPNFFDLPSIIKQKNLNRPDMQIALNNLEIIWVIKLLQCSSSNLKKNQIGLQSSETQMKPATSLCYIWIWLYLIGNKINKFKHVSLFVFKSYSYILLTSDFSQYTREGRWKFQLMKIKYNGWFWIFN